METPTQTCDLVMKGGVTSGIVYPRLVTRLARRYRFVRIGGSSAGAIAAAFTAAAEYERRERAAGRAPPGLGAAGLPGRGLAAADTADAGLEEPPWAEAA